jgi:type IV fimbrial biogenesis protein FimT
MNSKVKGLTLIDVLLAVTVLSVLLLVALPSFRTTILNNRLYSQTNEFYLSLMRARSEALSRVRRVTVCASSDGSSCTGNWEQGWIIFAEDHNSQNAALDPNDGDILLEVQQELAAGNTLRGDENVASYVSYLGTGFTRMVSGASQTGTLVLCDARGFNDGKAIAINAAGRPRVLDAPDSSLTTCDPNTP